MKAPQLPVSKEWILSILCMAVEVDSFLDDPTVNL